MEPMDIFYQILHEDLNPSTSQTTKNLNVEYSKNQGETNEVKEEKTIKKISQEKYLFYENLLADTLKKVKRDIHDKVFGCLNDSDSIRSIIQNQELFNWGGKHQISDFRK